MDAINDVLSRYVPQLMRRSQHNLAACSRVASRRQSPECVSLAGYLSLCNCHSLVYSYIRHTSSVLQRNLFPTVSEVICVLGLAPGPIRFYELSFNSRTLHGFLCSMSMLAFCLCRTSRTRAFGPRLEKGDGRNCNRSLAQPIYNLWCRYPHQHQRIQPTPRQDDENLHRRASLHTYLQQNQTRSRSFFGSEAVRYNVRRSKSSVVSSARFTRWFRILTGGRCDQSADDAAWSCKTPAVPGIIT